MSLSGLVHIGNGNYVVIARVIAVADARQQQIEEHIAEARRHGIAVDLCAEKPTRSVLFIDRNQLVLSSIRAETLASRLERHMLLRQAVLNET